jgi:hypothetical protein
MVHQDVVMATVTIPDSTYQQLQAIAGARRLSVPAYLAEIAAQGAVSNSDSNRQLAALESFSAGMAAWTSTHLPPGHQVDDRRETIYEGRGG